MSNPSIFLVTGGAGFIGSHLVDLLLEEGHKVKVVDNLTGGRKENIANHLDNPNFEFKNLDITELLAEDIFLNGIEYIIHLAGLGDIVPSIETPLDYFKVNAMGSARIVEIAKLKSVKKFVYAASSSCYGIADVPTTENAPINTIYPYAFTKYVGEQTVFHWAKVYNLKVNSIRIFNAYGTRSRTSGNYGAMFGVFLKQIIEKTPLTVVGDGNQSRDFVYVTDVAKAFYLAAVSNVSGEVFNIGGGNPRKINDIVKILNTHSVQIPERPGEPRITWADITKARNVLSWVPIISLEDGIKKM